MVWNTHLELTRSDTIAAMVDLTECIMKMVANYSMIEIYRDESLMLSNDFKLMQCLFEF